MEITRTSFKKRNPIALWLIPFILVIAALIYMIFAVFSNFETTLNKPQYIANGQQYDALISGNDLVSYSNTFLGMLYLWGGTTPAILDTTGKYISGGFDCSGFVQYIYKNFGIDLPRTTMDQVNKGVSVKINNLEKGDLVFFMTNPARPYEVSHVGIYIGNHKFIHSPNARDVIKISELTGYYKDKFVIGKRLIHR
ncbi:C40 family peptidase [Clostridium estertheticum]|uniref:C40 family peptidase n=1 Tax=Clostridium estertheticum TaxID=238834 RepID=UPI001CD13328|nr:C40 family peptidase [Clostridium estertheticum]MBZ9686735.1 C40 family peptidase [Clostridium estertheticum]